MINAMILNRPRNQVNKNNETNAIFTDNINAKFYTNLVTFMYIVHSTLFYKQNASHKRINSLKHKK